MYSPAIVTNIQLGNTVLAGVVNGLPSKRIFIIGHGLDNTGKENLLMVFQYTPAGFEEYFIQNSTLVSMPPNEKTEEVYTITEKKYGMIYKDKL